MKKRGKNSSKINTDVVLILGIVFVLIVTVYFVLNPYNPEGAAPATTIVSTKESSLPDVVKKPAVAGSFYPAGKGELSAMVGEYLGEAKSYSLPKVRGLVSPHAGYVYSGPTAAFGFRQLANQSYKTVIVLGPSHYVRFNGFSIPNASWFETPLGRLAISPKVLDLVKEKGFVNDARIHEQEHSVEVQVPFLQTVLKDFQLIPIVVGGMNPEELASILEKYVDDDTLVVASSDLSHYYTYEQARQLDSNCVNAIPSFNYSLMQKCEACGEIPVLALMHLSERQKWRGQLLDYRNSGDTAGDKSRVVGYGSIAYYQGLNEEEQKYLLDLSRKTLETYIKTGQVIEAIYPPEKTKEISGCFVTLNKNQNLRGCIGHILPQEELYQCVIDNTISAAVHDSRFRPVSESELSQIEIDISVLSVPKKLDYKNSDDLKEKLVPLVDGVVLKKNMRSATYLPQVWEMLAEKEEFLTILCEKTGLNGDCWTQNPEIQTYRAQVFKEE